jgi:hypothetical protein
MSKYVVPDSWYFADFKECELPDGVWDALKSAVDDAEDYKPILYLGHQMTNGMNHLILCEQTVKRHLPIINTNLVVAHLFIPEEDSAGTVSVAITSIEPKYYRA